MKKIALAIVLGLLLATIASATVHWLPAAKYATQYTLYFGIADSNSPWRLYETAPALADVHVFQDGASEARAANAVTDLGRSFSLVLSATEMTAAVVTVDVNDASAPPLFGDEIYYIPTFGNASGAWVFDLSTATVSPTNSSITTSTFASGAINAAAIAADAIGSSELATGAIDEILDNTLTNNKIKQSLAWYVQRGGGGDPLALSGTAQAGGTSNTIVLAAATPGVDDAFTPCSITLLSGTGAYAIRTGLTYNSTTKVLTILETWPGSPPNATTTYKIDYAPSSALSAEGVAQAGTTNTVQLASGDVGADNLTGLVQLVSGTGSGSTVYAVRDSYDANETIVITGTWAGASPDTTTYYKFTPAGAQVSDASTPTAGLSVADVQSALAGLGYDATLATNLGTANSNVTDILADTGAVDTASELRTLLVGANIELATEPNQSLIKAITDRLTLNNIEDNVQAAMDANSLLVNWTQARALIITDLAGISQIGDKVQVDMDANSVLANGTYGLSALHTDIAAVDANVTSIVQAAVIGEGTVATASTNQVFTLSAAFSAVAGAYPAGTLILVQDADDGKFYPGIIGNYTAGKVVTLESAMVVTPANADVVVIPAAMSRAPKSGRY